MFTYETRIHLRDTDATGVLYFTEQLRLALEAFESYLKKSDITLQSLIQDGTFLMPIVHAESDYSAPLFAGDEVVIQLTLSNLGTSSFTLQTQLFKQSALVGKTSIVHVTVAQESKKSILIPESLLKILVALKSDTACSV